MVNVGKSRGKDSVMNVIIARNTPRYFPSSFAMAQVVTVFLGTPSAGAAEDKAEYEFANVKNGYTKKGIRICRTTKQTANQELQGVSL